MAATYQVELERDKSGWWVASVPAVPGAHTQGRSIQQAMNRIRKALALWVDDAAAAELVPKVHLPADARHEVRRALAIRKHAAQAETDAAAVLRQAVWELSYRQKLSTRDVAAVLELSPARIDQLKPGYAVYYQAASAGTLSAKKAVRRRTAARRRSASKRATRR